MGASSEADLLVLLEQDLQVTLEWDPSSGPTEFEGHAVLDLVVAEEYVAEECLAEECLAGVQEEILVLCQSAVPGERLAVDRGDAV